MTRIYDFGVMALIIVVSISEAVTPSNPCDPSITVAAYLVFPPVIKNIVTELAVLPSWYNKPLRFINCTRRGLNRIPETIPSNVQFLDLSSNIIGHITKTDFDKFKDLQILRLQSNCIGDLSYNQVFCSGTGIRGAYDKNTFSSLAGLKFLDLQSNAFASFPRNLPPTLEYLDVSRSGIRCITKDDVNYLRNLLVLLARNTCYYCKPEGYLIIDQDAFADLPLQVVAIHENKINTSMLSKKNVNKLVFINLSVSFIITLKPSTLENLLSIKTLFLTLLNPNMKHVHVNVSHGAFDALTNLHYLDLSCNLIEYLPHNIFQYNTRLKALNLGGNCLAEVTLNPTFVPLNVELLFLGYNQCSKNFNHSFVAKLGPVFRNLSKLKILSFRRPKRDHTALFYSQPIAFPLINNETFHAIQNLSNLKAIFMSDGTAQKVDLTTIRKLPLLNEIDLHNNRITNITSSSAMLLKSLINNSAHPQNCLLLRFKYKILLSNNFLQNLEKSQLVHHKVIELDLSANLILRTSRNLFQYMPCLETISLKNNPLQFLHAYTFKTNKRLKYLFISSTSIVSSDQSLYFLENLSYGVQMSLTFVDDRLFRLLYKATNSSSITAYSVTKVDLSNNHIPDKHYIEIGLAVFPNLKSLDLCECDIVFTYFHLPTPLLQFLDLSHNKIREITSEFLASIPCVETLLLSFNELSYFEVACFNITPNLTHLDLSHNQITSIIKESSVSTFQNLKKLELQNNYIFELSVDIFSFSFLSQLNYLDLRWNSIECYCKLTLNVGRWLSQREYYLNQRPGFLPVCSYSLDKFGGCVTCTANQCKEDLLLEQSLLQHATRNYCFNSFYTLLAACYICFYVIFIALSFFFSSNRGMLWMAKFATRRIRSTQRRTNETNCSITFAFHGFVVFDTEDNDVGNWVDDQLVPQLTQYPPYLNIGVIGKDNNCGFSSPTQLLLKMEASKKIILVLTKSYGQSRQGKYVLSNVEYLSYQSGIDRTVIVTFENDIQVGGLLRRRQKQADMSLLQFPADERLSAIFWESLRHILLCQS